MAYFPALIPKSLVEAKIDIVKAKCVMSKRLVIGIVLILLAFLATVYYGYRKLIEAGYPSCVLSIEDVISREFQLGTLRSVNITNEWQILGEDEEQALFAKFRSEGHKFDCKQFARFADGSALVGSKGHIRFRRDGSLIRVLIESDEDHERPY